MLIALLVAIAPYVDLAVRLDLPIPECIPELIGVNEKTPPYSHLDPLIFYFADSAARIIVAPMRIKVESTCREPRWICLDYSVTCDNECVWGSSGRTKQRGETGDDEIILTAPMRCWDVTEPIVCRFEWHPSSLADMDGDCATTENDANMIRASRAPNRLRVWGELMKEWSVGPVSEPPVDLEAPMDLNVEQGP